MTSEEKELLKKVITRKQVIFKNGTYSYGTADNIEVDDDINDGVVDSEGMPILPPGIAMPPRTEDFIQNQIDALINSSQNEAKEAEAAAKAAQDAQIAEIMKKFESNIQTNVSSLFDNI